MNIPTLPPTAADAVLDDDQWWEDRARAEDQDERRRIQWQRWRDTVPSRFRNAALDEHTDPDAAAAARRLLDDLATGSSGAVVLHGHVGSGKTHLAWAILHEAIRRGIVLPQQILAGTESDLLGDTASAAWDDRQRLTADLLHPRHKIVFVDDVGRSHQMTDKARLDLWHRLANACWEQERILIITTNLRLGSPSSTAPVGTYLVTWVGEAAYDRIQDGGRLMGPPDRQMRHAHRDRQEDRA